MVMAARAPLTTLWTVRQVRFSIPDRIRERSREAIRTVASSASAEAPQTPGGNVAGGGVVIDSEVVRRLLARGARSPARPNALTQKAQLIV